MAGKGGVAKTGPSHAAKLAHIREATMGFHKETMAANEHKMQGSEKQIAWAKKIRSQFEKETRDIGSYVTSGGYKSSSLHPDDHAMFSKHLETARAKALANTSASSWIKNQRFTDSRGREHDRGRHRFAADAENYYPKSPFVL